MSELETAAKIVAAAIIYAEKEKEKIKSIEDLDKIADDYCEFYKILRDKIETVKIETVKIETQSRAGVF
jgi:methionine aminopeptidase